MAKRATETPSVHKIGRVFAKPEASKKKLKPSQCGLREPAKESRRKFLALLPQMMELQGQLIAFTTSCDKIGVKPEDYANWISRYPAISAELKRVRADALIELQLKVAKGEQGWQALCRIGELADPMNWIKPSNSGRPGNAKSGYEAVMAKRKGK